MFEFWTVLEGGLPEDVFLRVVCPGCLWDIVKSIDIDQVFFLLTIVLSG